MDDSLKITVTPALKAVLDSFPVKDKGYNLSDYDVLHDFGSRRGGPAHWPITEDHEWQTNISNSEAYLWEQRGFVISTPKATPTCSVEQLLKMNLSGVYLHKPTSIQGVWPILMPRQPMPDTFPGSYIREEFIEYMPIPERRTSFKNFDFQKIKNIDFNALLKKKEEKTDE